MGLRLLRRTVAEHADTEGGIPPVAAVLAP